MGQARPLISLALACTMQTGAHAQTVWQLASGYPAELFQTQNLMLFSRDVAAATHGQLDIQVRPNGALAPLAAIPEAVESGRAAMGEVIMSQLVRQVPAAGADAVPFLVDGYPDALRLWKAQRPVVERALARRGLMVLYAVPWPSQGLFSTHEVKTLDDLRFAHMRTYNTTTVRIAQLMHATPVDVPLAGISSALAAGRVDSMITSAVTGVDNQVWDRMKYFYDIKAWYPKNIVVANLARFEALPSASQAAVWRAAAVAQARGWQMSEAAERDSEKTLAVHGVQIKAPGFLFENDLRRLGDHFSIEWVHATGEDASAILIPYYMDGAAPASSPQAAR